MEVRTKSADKIVGDVGEVSDDGYGLPAAGVTVKAQAVASEKPSHARIFVRLLGFLKPYRESLVVSSVLVVAARASQVAIALVTGRVIDRDIRPHDPPAPPALRPRLRVPGEL